MTDYSYRSWRSLLYLSGSYCYSLHDDVALQSHSHSSYYTLGSELDEFFLGEKYKSNL